MAILLSKKMNILGSDIDQIYIRLDYLVEKSGSIVNINLYPYYSKDAYLQSPLDNVLNINEFKSSYKMGYNKTIDGDLLEAIHKYVIKNMCTEVYRTLPSGDTDDEGNLILDASTNLPITKQYLIKEKFIDIDNVKIIDLD